MRERWQLPCAKVLGVAEQHLKTIERQVRQLSQFRDELRRAGRQWKRSEQQQLSADAFCALIENTMNKQLAETQEEK